MSELAITKQQKGLYISFQLVGWSCYAGLLVVALYLQGDITRRRVFLVVSSAVTGLVITHLMRFTYFKLRFFEKKTTSLISKSLLVILLSAIAFEIISVCIVLFVNINAPLTFLSFIGDVLSLFFILLIWSIIYFANHFIRKSRLEEVKNLQLTSANNEIELSHLRTQLNPHFLFNALNSIKALINIDPEVAKESVTKLSSILRNSLLFGKNKYITIEEECNFVDDYLSLEKIRFEERLNVVWELDKNVKSIMIPPLIIQTQVENAIKHGISNRIKGGVIEILIKNKENLLKIEVRNTGHLQQSNRGIGLTNTARRLKLMYGENANYKLYETSGTVISLIKIELK